MRFPLAKPDKAHTNLPPPKISHFKEEKISTKIMEMIQQGGNNMILTRLTITPLPLHFTNQEKKIFMVMIETMRQP